MSKLKYGYPALGGKTALLPVLKPIIEKCALRYNLQGILDLCGGGNKIIPNINIYRYNFRQYNELERGLACLTACLCDEELTRKLIITIDGLIGTGDPKEIFESAKRIKDEPNTDIVLSGACTFYVIYSSFAANRKSFNRTNFEKKFIEKKIHFDLARYNGVMKGVTVTSANCFDLLNKYSGRQDFISFLDVPYVGSAMKTKNQFKFTWPDKLHNKLIDNLIDEGMKMKWIVCGYKNNLYERLESRDMCTKYFVGKVPVTSGGMSGKVGYKEEYIWTNMNLDGMFLPINTNKKAS